MPLKLLCWEGYDAEPIARSFRERHGFEIEAQTLLSDALVADQLLAGEHARCDVLNINNAYIRDCLVPAGRVVRLDGALREPYLDSIHELYRPLLPWSFDDDGALIGIGQRYGPFNLVINCDAISCETAEDLGFALADEPRFAGRFGILDYPDFNLFHVCIGAGFNPFEALTEARLAQFEATAERWLRAAAMLETDHHRLNRALVDGDIDFYISGGIYTVSPARLAGHQNLLAITPRQGPIDGKGGIAFTEITSILDHGSESPAAHAFIEFMLEPETAAAIAFVEGTCNPVAQMGDPAVFAAFDTAQLNAIQWNTLDQQMQRCAQYRIPPGRHLLLPRLEELKMKYWNSTGELA